LEAAVGLGVIMGPLIGSALYTQFGFRMTFAYYGSFFLVFAIFIRFVGVRTWHKKTFDQVL